LILLRELDEHLGMSQLIEHYLTDPWREKNTQLPLADLLHPSHSMALAGGLGPTPKFLTAPAWEGVPPIFHGYWFGLRRMRCQNLVAIEAIAIHCLRPGGKMEILATFWISGSSFAINEATSNG
jgi:hypothetical protein